MFYKVLTKCGHVRRNHYILKWVYIKALNAKEAASIARNMPRVKHHYKDAIRNVIKIEADEYLNGLKIMNNDMYFQIHNSSDQKIYNCIKQEEIYLEEAKEKHKKLRNKQIEIFSD